MRAAGMPIDVYSKQLGHSDIKTTQIYMGDLSPEHLAGSAIQRDAWLEAVNAKIEQELADEAAARSANPTKNPTTSLPPRNAAHSVPTRSAGQSDRLASVRSSNLAKPNNLPK